VDRYSQAKAIYLNKVAANTIQDNHESVVEKQRAELMRRTHNLGTYDSHVHDTDQLKFSQKNSLHPLYSKDVTQNPLRYDDASNNARTSPNPITVTLRDRLIGKIFQLPSKLYSRSHYNFFDCIIENVKKIKKSNPRPRSAPLHTDTIKPAVHKNTSKYQFSGRNAIRNESIFDSPMKDDQSHSKNVRGYPAKLF
jgi:hypothetical protein